uniref:Trans-1,2-dihydrobenzene-1,2-diol dehydrogenase n=1 Tax=Oryzias sinensis TaxID=183150 RepID=A0A8C7X7Z4_9TELE
MATRWGICSAGKISQDFAVALKTLPAADHQIVAVAARKLEDAQEFATKRGASRAYGSYEELARDPDVDVVYVGVIHPHHLKTCLLFINAKKNVLCEKPLAMNAREVKEILDAAKRNNVFLMEVKLEHEPVIGKIREVETSIFFNNYYTIKNSIITDIRFGAEPNSELLVLPQAVWTRFFPASEEIRRLLARGEVGLKESTIMSHADSLLLAELEDEIRRQVGVVYSQDCQ